MSVVGLDHLVLTVADIEATCAFYVKALGMQREVSSPAAGPRSNSDRRRSICMKPETSSNRRPFTQRPDRAIFASSWTQPRSGES